MYEYVKTDVTILAPHFCIKSLPFSKLYFLISLPLDCSAYYYQCGDQN